MEGRSVCYRTLAISDHPGFCVDDSGSIVLGQIILGQVVPSIAAESCDGMPDSIDDDDMFLMLKETGQERFGRHNFSDLCLRSS